MGYFFTRAIFCVLIFLAVEQSIAQSQTLLPGDVVIVGYNFKDPDEFSLLAVVDLLPGTVFYITDSGWNTLSSSFRKGEGLITYTVPVGGIRAGEQIVYPYATGFLTEGMSGFFGLATAGDQLFVFQGSVSSPQFVFGISDYDGSWQNSAEVITNQNSHLPLELEEQKSALALAGYHQARFDCNYFQLEKSAFLAQLTNSSRWVKESDRVILPLEACNFTSLELVNIQWNYKFKEGNCLALYVLGSELYQKLDWYIYYQEREERISCTLENGKYYCDLSVFDTDQLLIKPCYKVSEGKDCGTYRVIEKVRTNEIYAFTGKEHGSVTIESNGLVPIHAYYLFDIMGRLMRSEEDLRATELTVNNLNIGVYLLKLRVGLEWKELKVYVTN